MLAQIQTTEEVRDLLVFDTASGAPTRRGAFGVKSRIPEVTVRDDGKGGIKLDGVQERTVESTEQALGFLERYVRLVLACCEAVRCSRRGVVDL